MLRPMPRGLVPVRNGGGDLRTLPAKLSQQTIERHRFDVVIADGGSNDGRAENLSDEWVGVLAGLPRNSCPPRNRALQASSRLLFLRPHGARSWR